MTGTPVRLDIVSIECEDPIDKGNVNDIIDRAVQVGYVYPPIVVCQVDDNEYLVMFGGNTLAAARKLNRRNPERFPEQIEAYIVDSGGQADMLQEMLMLAQEN